MLFFSRLEKKENNRAKRREGVAKEKGEESDPDVCGEIEERKSFGQHGALHHVLLFLHRGENLAQEAIKMLWARKSF